jgi:hypothetical protein
MGFARSAGEGSEASVESPTSRVSEDTWPTTYLVIQRSSKKAAKRIGPVYMFAINDGFCSTKTTGLAESSLTPGIPTFWVIHMSTWQRSV